MFLVIPSIQYTLDIAASIGRSGLTIDLGVNVGASGGISFRPHNVLGGETVPPDVDGGAGGGIIPEVVELEVVELVVEEVVELVVEEVVELVVEEVVELVVLESHLPLLQV